MLASFQLKSPRIALHPTPHVITVVNIQNRMNVRDFIYLKWYLRAGSPVTGAEDWPVATEYY